MLFDIPLATRIALGRPQPFRGRIGPEERIGIDLANGLRARLIEKSDIPPWCHVPNEGRRSRAAGALLRAQGLFPGFADYIFPRPGSLMIELKAGNEKQTPNQDLAQEWCDLTDMEYRIARSAREALDIYQDWHSR